MTINLSLLPPPNVVEPLDYETILATLKADFLSIAPEFANTLFLESEPATKLLEVFAYRELLLRARINNAAKSVMLAYAQGSDLDHLAALLDVERLENETDDRLRARAQLAPESLSVAGPIKAYYFHALSASNKVRDAHVYSPEPGVVATTILSERTPESPDGIPSVDLLQDVREALNAEDVRPLTDTVYVNPAEIIKYSISAEIITEAGISPQAVLDASIKACFKHAEDMFMLGRSITESGIKRALRVPGVSYVNIQTPTKSSASQHQDTLVEVNSNQAPLCVETTILLGE